MRVRGILIVALAAVCAAMIPAPAEDDPILFEFEEETTGEALRRLASSTPTVRQQAVRDLVRIGAPAVPALVKALHDPSPEVQRSATVSLGPIGQPSVAALMELLKGATPSLHRSACEALGTIGPDAEPAIPLLAQILEHDDIGLMGVATRALGRIGPKSIPTLLDVLGNQDTGALLSCYTLEALGMMGEKAKPSVSTLTGIVADIKQPAFVRYCAASALGDIGSYEALETLRAAAESEDPKLRKTAEAAIRKIETP